METTKRLTRGDHFQTFSSSGENNQMAQQKREDT